MKWTILSLFFILFNFTGPASAELIILKSGKSIKGIIKQEDSASILVGVEAGDVKIPRSSIEKIVLDDEVEDWQAEQKELEPKPTPEFGTTMTIIDQDKPVIREKTYDEISKASERFDIKNLVSIVQEEGNAASIYWKILDAKKFKMGDVASSQGGVMQWSTSNPIFDDLMSAARMKDCNFYPEYLPYPVGIRKNKIQFIKFFQISGGLIYKSQREMNQERPDEALASLETALVLGCHLEQHAPLLKQYAFSKLIQQSAGEALAEFYSKRNDKKKSEYYLDFIKKCEKDIDSIKLAQQGFFYDFNSGKKVNDLIEYVRHGNNDILRSYVMNLLLLIKAGDEQQPLRSDIMEKIPLESHYAFNSIAPGEADRINSLFRELAQNDESDFIRLHARELLSSGSIRLPQMVKLVLGKK